MVRPMPDDPDETAQMLDQALQVEQQQERTEQQADLARQGDVDARLAEALMSRNATTSDPT